jgi:hypothetical protein
MKKLIGFKTAVNVALAILGLVILFHIGVLTGIVPNDIVWGGKIPIEQVPIFEVISILLNAVFILLIAIKAKYIKAAKLAGFARVAIWVLFAVFILNTIGNTQAEQDFEKFVFTPMTAVLALLMYRIAIEKN